jgi:steroid 5-alpha reductase family enzyme
MSVPFVEQRPWSGYAALVLAYAVALAAAVLAVRQAPADWHPLALVFLGEVVATVVLFIFAVVFDNTAFFNAHWSLAPIVVAVFFIVGPGAARGVDTRQLLVLGVVSFYGLRLTFNWLRSWAGLKHEDWQYTDFRTKFGKAFWPVSLLAFHLFPMLLVFAGCLPLYAMLVEATTPVGPLDVLGVAFTTAAIVIEWVADEQLRTFRRSPEGPGSFCTRGLWRWSRHPNYFGEVSFWFGLWLCGLAAGAPWWSAFGWLGMAGLFLGASIPMADTRSLERRKGYAEYAARTSRFLPLPPKG